MANPDPAVAIWLQPPPVDGAANAALLRFVAERLDVAPSAVELLRGHTSRRRLISVASWSAEAVRQGLLASACQKKVCLKSDF